MGSANVTSHYGPVINPWTRADGRDLVPGGSSGGSAAALAAGLSALEAGSDIGGSLRAPAHYCGVYAHKPSWGICPLRGHSIQRNVGPVDIAVIGPMARSAEDLGIALEIMAGADMHQAGWQLKLPKPRVKSLKELRVAILPDHEICPVEAQISQSLLALGKHLADAGAKVSFTARPDLDPAQAHENYLLLLHAALSTRMPEATLAALRGIANAAPQNHAPNIVAARGAVMDHLHWLRANEYRLKKRLAWKAFFQEYDVLISPIASTAAVTHDVSEDMGRRTITVDDAEITVADQLFWAGYASNFLLPSTAAPLGFNKSGLPFGMQIIGAPYADCTTIAVASWLEKSWLGFAIPPAYKS
jgi:amidase